MAAKLELTVSQLNEYVRRMFQMDPMLRAIELKGEISNLKFHQSGALFFTMKDENAAISCVMYADEAENLQAMPFEGMRATASGSVALYARGGQYQFVVKRLHAQGVGVLYERLQMLKEKLGREGLFAPERKRALPRYPDTVGVVSSPTGAVIHDILNVSLRRNPNARILLCPVRVQGVEAPAEIAGAIRYANEFKVADLIITGRGGGSIEDLWAFNDERVARAIYASELPVISAVGHEPDVTISDYVADLRASTPSNAAELAVPDMREVAEQLQGMEIRSAQSMAKRLTQLRERLSGYASKRVMTAPSVLIDNRRMELDMSRERLVSVMERGITARRHGYVRLASALDAMSPLRVLTRGYAIASDDTGAVVKSTAQLRVGDSVTLRVADGSVGCTVNTVTPDKNLED